MLIGKSRSVVGIYVLVQSQTSRCPIKRKVYVNSYRGIAKYSRILIVAIDLFIGVISYHI